MQGAPFRGPFGPSMKRVCMAEAGKLRSRVGLLGFLAFFVGCFCGGSLELRSCGVSGLAPESLGSTTS